MKKAKFVIRTPAGRSLEFLLAAPVTTIGRSAACDLTFESAYISRRHAHIECVENKHVIVDEKSKNGVFLNGKRITKPQPIKPGDEVRVGDISMVYSAVKPEDESTELMLDEVTPEGAPIRLDPTTWEVWVEERKLELRLSLQEFTLLSLLCGHAGHICARADLADAVWGEGKWDLNMLHRLVHRLREKVEPDPTRPQYVVNVPGVGYRLLSADCD